MKVICDTREKKNGHVLKCFEMMGVPYEVKKLDTADYKIDGKDDIVIDRKQNLEELARNLTNKSDKSRFWKEVRRSFRDKTKMIVLCEHSRNITCIDDVANWHSKFSPVSGRSLMNEIYRVHIAYGIEFIFCSKADTGRKILELLEYDKCICE